MLEFLTKVFGPHRAVSVYVFMQNRGIALLALLAFGLGVGGLIYATAPRSHEHIAFETLPVATTMQIGNQAQNGLIVTVRLTGAETVTITTTEGEVAATVTDTACVEKRQYSDTGELRYRIKLRHYCD